MAKDAFDKLSPEVQELLAASNPRFVAMEIGNRKDESPLRRRLESLAPVAAGAAFFGTMAAACFYLLGVTISCAVTVYAPELSQIALGQALVLFTTLGGLMGGAAGAMKYLDLFQQDRLFSKALDELLALDGPVGLTARLLQDAESQVKRKALASALEEALEEGARGHREREEREVEATLTEVSREAERALRPAPARFALEGPTDDFVQDRLPGESAD